MIGLSYAHIEVCGGLFASLMTRKSWCQVGMGVGASQGLLKFLKKNKYKFKGLACFPFFSRFSFGFWKGTQAFLG